MLAGSEGGGISVDTKTLGVPEIANNILSNSHDRFRRECEMAQRCGIQLIVLIEEQLPEGRLDKWVSPLGRDGKPKYRFDPVILRKAMYTMQDKYGVKFRFCDGRSTGKRLFEYLKGERT